MCGCTRNCILARAPIRPNSAWKALGVIGPSRSVIKTCEDGPCSRCRRRRARISSPCIGWRQLQGLAVEQAQHLLRSRGQLLQQGLGLLQIARVEALGEPAVDGSKKIAGLLRLALIAPE